MKRKANDPRSAYILAALERHCLNGDAYVMVEELYALCCTLRPRLGYEAFERDFTDLNLSIGANSESVEIMRLTVQLRL